MEQIKYNTRTDSADRHAGKTAMRDKKQRHESGARRKSKSVGINKTQKRHKTIQKIQQKNTGKTKTHNTQKRTPLKGG